MSIGKISAIPITPDPAIQSMTNSLAAAGKTRYPGTGAYFYPQKDTAGRYKTGLDENAPDILMIEDERERKAAQKRIKDKRKRLEDVTGFDLSPKSSFWNYTKYTSEDQAHVQAVRLGEGDTLFDFSKPINEINFTWLRECDDIAVSYESYIRGDKGPGVRFYVHDEEIETKRTFDRKKAINDAIAANNELSPDKRKKIAILMGLSIADNTPETTVYNILDDQLKETEYKSGRFRGMSPVRLFNDFLKMDNRLLNTKFLVEEAIKYNVYRMRADGIYEGEYKINDSQQDLVTFLINDDHQEELIALEKKVKAKKVLAV